MASSLAWPGELDTAACHQRFRQLQELRITQGLDALIIAIGPDAAFSRANEAVFNWLLLGLSGREAYGSVSGRYEESLVCLSDRNWIFCKKADFEDLTLRTARWDATSLVAPPDQDPDYYEDKKMGTFIEMVKDCRKLGVFVGKHELSQSSDLKMTVEKWPVVQAFGYDEFGLGFMTLHRELVNLEPKLSELFSTWDPPAVSWAQQTMLKLQKSWADALIFHDQHSREEASAAAPIVDYFIYGHLDEEVDRAISPCPRVLVGKQTSEILKDAIPGESMAQDDVNARHMIWEAVDPMTGASMTRTYGLMTPFDTKMQDVLVAYAACCRCCRTFLLEKVAGAEAARRATEIFQTAGLERQVPEIFDCGLDAFGAPVPGGGLRFLRICCRLEDGSYVSYGDSSFDGSGVLLGESKETPSFAFWAAASEEGRSKEIQDAFETAMGLKLDWGRSVALGHRKDVRVYLDPPEQPPDSLNLGEEPLDTETFCELAVTIGDGSPGPVAFATGKCWTYASGKVVVSSGRSGYLLLTVQRRSLKSTLPAEKGQLWVAMDAQNSPSCLKIALSVSPDTLSSWHSRWASGDTTGDELGWLAQNLMRGSLPTATSPMVGPASTGRTQKQLLVTGLPGCAAIDVAHTLSRLLHAPFLDLEDGTSKPTDTPLDLSRLQELQGEEEWLVLCDVLRDPSTLQAQLPELRVLSILDPMLAYPWHSCRHPRLRCSVPNASVVAVGRTGPKETQDQRALGTLLAKELQRSVGREVLLRPLTSDLVAAVQTALPASPDGAAFVVEGLPSFSRCFVPCGVLDLQLLRQRLMKCLEEAAEQCCKLPLAKVSPWKGLFAVEVKALVVDSSQDFWRSTDLSSDGTKNLVEKNLVFTQKGELPPRQHWQEPLASKCGALFWFCGPSPSSPALVSAEMAQCAVLEPQEEPLWLVDTVPEDVRSKLVKDLRSQGPPDGYSFDGNRYFHQEDYRTQKDHPHLAMRLQQLVTEQNATEQHRRQRAKEMLAVAPFTRPMSPSRPAGPGNRAPVSRPPRLPRMSATVPGGVGPAGYPQVD